MIVRPAVVVCYIYIWEMGGYIGAFPRIRSFIAAI